MELQSFSTVQVQTFDPNENILRVSVPVRNDEVLVECLHARVCKDLGLKKESLKYFALFQGLESPSKKFRCSDSILIATKDISFQKWCFQSKEEKKMVKSDSQAAHLLCLQNQHLIKFGRYLPSETEKEKLQEYLDPSFPTEEQYVLACQSLDNYFSVQVSNCIVCQSTVVHDTELPRDSILCIYVSKHDLKITSGNGLNASISWYDISKWAWNKEEETLTYTVQAQELSTPFVLQLKTPQSEYLLAATMEAVRVLMTEHDDCPVFHASMINDLPGGITVWNNCLHPSNNNS